MPMPARGADESDRGRVDRYVSGNHAVGQTNRPEPQYRLLDGFADRRGVDGLWIVLPAELRACTARFDRARDRRVPPAVVTANPRLKSESARRRVLPSTSPAGVLGNGSGSTWWQRSFLLNVAVNLLARPGAAHLLDSRYFAGGRAALPADGQVFQRVPSYWVCGGAMVTVPRR